MDASTNPFGVKQLATQGARHAGAILKRNQISALHTAEEITLAAEAHAQNLISEAQADAARIRSDARDIAQKEIWNEAETLLAELKTARQQLADQSIEVAKTILQKAWEILAGGMSEVERLHSALEQASRYFVSTSAMKLRVNPSNIAPAQTWLDQRRTLQPGLELLILEPDISVRPDEVRLYLDRGGVIRAEFSGTLEILKAQWI